MKNKLQKILAAFVIFAIILTSSVFVFAEVVDKESQYEFKDNDFFMADEDVNLKMVEVDGNIFIAGKDVLLEDLKVEGTLFVAGQDVELRGVYASGDIFVAGQKVTINTTEVKNIFAAAQKLTFEDETVVKRDAYIAGNDVKINASMDTLNIGANTLTIGSAANITKATGELGNEASISSNAVIETNNLTVEVVEEVKKVPSVLDKILEIIGKAVRLIVFSLIIAFIVVKANKAERIKNYDGEKIVINSAIGLGLCFGLIMVSIMLLFTVILTLVGIIGIFAYISMLLCSTAAGCVVVALKILGKKEANMKNTLLFTALVALVLTVVSVIPLLGDIAKAIMALLGIGTLFDIIFLKDKKQNQQEVVNVTE